MPRAVSVTGLTRMWLAAAHATGGILGSKAACQQPELKVFDKLRKPLAVGRIGRLQRALQGPRQVTFQFTAFAAGHEGVSNGDGPMSGDESYLRGRCRICDLAHREDRCM
jgi:hypothetical protein